MDGGELNLFNPAGQLVTTLVYGKQSPDVSYGRAPDNGDTWGFFDQPTPGQANDTPAFAANNAAAFAARPQFSVAGGLHSGPQSVELTSTDAGATIRYTTDGSRPTTSSPLYTGSIAVNDNTVIRARAWAAGKMVSPTATQTYLINVPTNLPIISLVIDPPYLWDSRIGFYVKGSNGVNGCRGKANWHQKWERPGNFEFYEMTGENRLNQEVGVDISGNCTRNLPQKSFEIKARKLYGDNDMDYAFFDDKPMTSFKRLILRSGGQDNSRAYMRDALAQNLSIGRMDLDRQAYRPAAVYLNGEYWGLYNMREKMDEDYVENNYDLDEEDFDMVELNGRLTSGSLTAWESFYDFIKTTNITSPSGYAAVQERMDVNSFIDYIILETYVANTDWPRNNTRWWDDHGNQYKWRWVLKDLDFAFLARNLKRDMITYLMKGKAPTTVVFNKLWANADFRNEFAQRYAVHLNTTFLPANVIGLIDEMANGIRAEIPAQTARWGGKPGSLAVWETEVQDLRTQATQRPAYARSTLRTHIGKPADATLTINTDGNGRVLVAGAEVPHSYSGPHFRGIPMTLTAVPDPGATFSHWLETGETSLAITIPFVGDTTRTAVFGGAPPPPPIVINEIHYNPLSGLLPTPDDYEFLELVNTGVTTVDLSGFAITEGIVYTFPSGTSIAPGEFIILAKNATTYAGNGYQVFQWAGGALSNGGETVTLTDTFGQTVDTLAYDDVAPWPVSPDGAGPSLSLLDPALDNALAANWAASLADGGTPGAGNFPTLPLVINEIYYNPITTPTVTTEFIEIINTGPATIHLEGFTLEGVDFTFPAATSLPAGGHLVIAAPGHSYPGALTWTSGDLDDAGETITLKDSFGQVVDAVTYGVAAPWPDTPGGSGLSLSLRDPALDNTEATNWAASLAAGGTPGAVNFPGP